MLPNNLKAAVSEGLFYLLSCHKPSPLDFTKEHGLLNGEVNNIKANYQDGFKGFQLRQQYNKKVPPEMSAQDNGRSFFMILHWLLFLLLMVFS